MYVWGKAATFHGGHDAPGAKGALNATKTAGQELPSAWGEVSMAVSYKDRQPQQLSCQAEYVLLLFSYCQPLVCLGFLSLLLLSQFESSLCSSEWSTGFFVTPGFEAPRAKKVGSSSTKSAQSHFTELL